MKLDNLSGKKIGIIGIQGTGKTFFARKLLQYFKAAFVYRITADFDNEPDNVFLFEQTDKYRDLDFFLMQCKRLGQKKIIDAFVIDEFDLFATEARLEQGLLNELVTMHRNYNLSFVWLSRRPQDIPSKVFESSHFVVVFKIEGPSAIRKLTELHPKFAELMPLLDFDRHNFIVKELGKEPVLCGPL